MKKKFLLLILAFIPFSAFAGTDTDRICADHTIQGKYLGDIVVSYPGEIVSVHNVQKYFHVTKGAGESSEGYMELYYVVNIRKPGTYINQRSELYSYNCEAKKATLLLNIPILGDGLSYFTIDYLNNSNLILVQKYFGQSEGGTEYIRGYNIITKKKFLDIKWSGSEGSIDGFINSKNYWYLYFPSEDFSGISALYRIDKKTKKIIKL